MKEIAQIEYLDIEKDENYEKIINKVLKECFIEENLLHTNMYISITLTNPENIKKINKEYRNIDKETDVLSFPMLSDDFDIELEEESLGDIVISLERAFEQSKEYNHSFEREVCFLVCHSTFHLLGYDHDTEENTKQMREKEEYILNKLNITRE